MNIRKIFRIAKHFEKMGADPRQFFGPDVEPSPPTQPEFEPPTVRRPELEAPDEPPPVHELLAPEEEEAPATVREPEAPATEREPTAEPPEDERWPGPAAEFTMKESMIDYVIRYLNRNIERDRKAIAAHQARGTKSEKQIAGLLEHLNKIEEIIATLDDSIKRQRLRIAP